MEANLITSVLIIWSLITLSHCHRNTGPLHGAHNNTQIYTNQALTKEILQHSHSPTASARGSGNLNNLRRFQKTQVCHTEINCYQHWVINTAKRMETCLMLYFTEWQISLYWGQKVNVYTNAYIPTGKLCNSLYSLHKHRNPEPKTTIMQANINN